MISIQPPRCQPVRYRRLQVEADGTPVDALTPVLADMVCDRRDKLGDDFCIATNDVSGLRRTSVPHSVRRRNNAIGVSAIDPHTALERDLGFSLAGQNRT